MEGEKTETNLKCYHQCDKNDLRALHCICNESHSIADDDNIQKRRIKKKSKKKMSNNEVGEQKAEENEILNG